MKKAQRNILIATAGIAVFAIFVLLANPNQDAQGGDGQTPGTFQSKGSSVLTAAEGSYNFGSISMAAGKVTRMFKIKNNGDKEVKVSKLYTSCMCTSASLITSDGRRGPFSMPGHSSIPVIDVPLKAGEEAEIEVVYDPAAHGPAGVGRIERDVILENDAGAPLTLKIAANVTP